MEGKGLLKMAVSLISDLFDGLCRVVTIKPGQGMALEEMAQQLRLCPAPSEHLSSVPSTYVRRAAHTHL